jgi:hypothetical protein
VRLRRFSQLGWHGCQDLAGFVMGEEVERVELGPPPVYEQSLTEALWEAALTTGCLTIEVGGDE